MSLAETYERIDRLGEGTYGIVYKARDRKTNQIVALKRMVPVNDAEGIPGTTMREIAFLRELRHPNIVTLHDVVFNVPKLTLVFECCEMDLAKYLKSKPFRRLPGPDIKRLMRQFLEGLAHMHDRCVMHRDLKPHNLLLCDQQTTLKIADFGLARIHGIPVKKYRHDAVTLWYRPPDLLLGSIMYGFGMDIWSAGCIFAEMIGGSVFFQTKTESDQLFSMFEMMGFPNALTSRLQSQSVSPKDPSVTVTHASSVAPSLGTSPGTIPRQGSFRGTQNLGSSAGNTGRSRVVDDEMALQDLAPQPAPPTTSDEGRSRSPRSAPPSSKPIAVSQPVVPALSGVGALAHGNDWMLDTESGHGIYAEDSLDDPSVDIFPSMSRYPNFETMMEKSLLQRYQQLLDANDGVAPPPKFEAWVDKTKALEVVGWDGVDLLMQMLQLEPSRRISAHEALQHSYFSERSEKKPPASSVSNTNAAASNLSSSSALPQRPLRTSHAADQRLAFEMLWSWAPFQAIDDPGTEFGSVFTGSSTTFPSDSANPYLSSVTGKGVKIPMPPGKVRQTPTERPLVSVEVQGVMESSSSAATTAGGSGATGGGAAPDFGGSQTNVFALSTGVMSSSWNTSWAPHDYAAAQTSQPSLMLRSTSGESKQAIESSTPSAGGIPASGRSPGATFALGREKTTPLSEAPAPSSSIVGGSTSASDHGTMETSNAFRMSDFGVIGGSKEVNNSNNSFHVASADASTASATAPAEGHPPLETVLVTFGPT